MRLAPPYLEGTIPAFYTTESKGMVITIPFSMNRAIKQSDITGYQLKIKTVQGQSLVLAALETREQASYDIENNKYLISFSITDEILKQKFKIGQYYKIQLAYLGENYSIGYFSTISTIKYTTKPTVCIENLNPENINNHTYIYKGQYSQSNYVENETMVYRDATEKEYQYRFLLIDEEGNILDDTGILLHDITKNKNNYQSEDEYQYESDLLEGNKCYLQYMVYTNNKLFFTSPIYQIQQGEEKDPPIIKADISAKLNYDNAYIDIKLIGHTDEITQKESYATGSYIISRACSDDNFTSWNEVFRFSLFRQQPSLQVIKDFTIEHGKQYIYALQEKIGNKYSSKMKTNIVQSYFEDIFLYDGERQLKLRFNPKVSSFKINVAENKTDSMGLQFPFIFKNNNARYKEINLNGLLSYLSDEENLFITDKELNIGQKPIFITNNGSFDYLRGLGIYDRMKALSQKNIDSSIKVESYDEMNVRTVAPVGYNFMAERTFKNKVLDWLNNGTVKLFKSPTEGNFLAYLINVSLTPETKTNHLIDTFQATAYEIEDYSPKDLLTYNIIKEEKIPQWASLELSTYIDPEDERYVLVNNVWYLRGSILPAGFTVSAVWFEGMTPGATIDIRLDKENVQTVVIGVTGDYTLNIEQDIVYIAIPNDACYNGIITYKYYEEKE